MSIVVLKLPDVKRKTEGRPRECPYCQGETFQRWGQIEKPVKDVHVRQVKVYRYRCCGCKHTFRHYPEGNTRADQTERVRLLAVLLWTLGLSHRASSWILSGLKVLVSHMTVWRDVQQEAQQLKKRKHWKPVQVLGLDGAYVFHPDGLAAGGFINWRDGLGWQTWRFEESDALDPQERAAL